MPFLDAKLNFHPGNEEVTFQLNDANGSLVATAEFTQGKRLRAGNLTAGNYTFQVSGMLSQGIDFVIHSCQSSTPPEE